ncbi:MAG TPA: hypothetical protein VIX80_07285 [Candidatus Kapabacteria bacterium]
MRTITAVFLLAISVSFFSSCSEDSTTPGNYTIKDVFPISVGSKWELRESDFDTSGAVTSIDTVEFRIEKDTTFHGIPAYNAFIFDDYQTIYTTDKDLWRVESGSDISEFVFRYPMADGEIYVIKDTTMGSYRSRRTMRILSQSEKTTVPAGIFDCIKYELLYMSGPVDGLDTSSLIHVFLSPGTGYIKEQGFSRTGKTTKSYELLKYTK